MPHTHCEIMTDGCSSRILLQVKVVFIFGGNLAEHLRGLYSLSHLTCPLLHVTNNTHMHLNILKPQDGMNFKPVGGAENDRIVE